MTRVVFVDHTAQLGGAELAMCAFAGVLDSARWDCCAVLGQPGPLVDRLQRAGVSAEVVPFPECLLRPGSGIGWRELRPASLAAIVRAIWQLSRWLRRSGAGLVHANSLRAFLLAAPAARLARIPVVWQVHSVVAPPVITRATAYLLWVLARVLPSRIICNSEATALSLGAPRGRTTVIPPGVETSRLCAVNGGAQTQKRAGMIARLAPLKGQHVFVQAATLLSKRLPQAEFVVAGAPLFGEEAYAKQVRRQADAVPGRRVRFLGFVDDVPALLDDLTVVVHPSVRPEGFGQAVVEAMLAGKPVVATPLGGTAEIVQDGITGVLVPADDAEALASAIERILNDPAAAVEMGRRGRARALELYDVRQTATAMEQVYREALAA